MEVDLAPKLCEVFGGDGGAVAVFRLVVLMVGGSWKLLLRQVIFCFCQRVSLGNTSTNLIHSFSTSVHQLACDISSFTTWNKLSPLCCQHNTMGKQ